MRISNFYLREHDFYLCIGVNSKDLTMYMKNKNITSALEISINEAVDIVLKSDEHLNKEKIKVIDNLDKIMGVDWFRTSY